MESYFCDIKGGQDPNPSEKTGTIGVDVLVKAGCFNQPEKSQGSSVCAFAVYLFQRCNAAQIIDIGCGHASTMARRIPPSAYLGVGTKDQVQFAKKDAPGARFLEMRLDEPMILPSELLRQSVVVCHDTFMRQQEPHILLSSIIGMADIAPFVLVSAEVWGDDVPESFQSLTIQGDTRLAQFGALFNAGGCSNVQLGFVDGFDGTGKHNSMMALLGAHAAPPKEFEKKSVLAIVSCFNDDDFIDKTIEHLLEQNVSVWVLDNWSTDSTWEILKELQKNAPIGAITLERFPANGPENNFKWKEILNRKEAIARVSDYDWFIHYDSDELRESPWPGVSLRDALSAVDAMGYNAVDHTVLNMRPIRDGFAAGSTLDDFFTHGEFSRSDSGFLQIKAWAKRDEPLGLSRIGGHFVSFSDISLFPLKFMLNHYSLRSKKQGDRKLNKERLPRIMEEEKELGWHSHYRRTDIQKATELVFPAEYLFRYEERQFKQDFLVERLSGIDAKLPPYRIVI